MEETIATANQNMSPAILAEHELQESRGSHETIQSKDRQRRTQKKGKVILNGPVRDMKLTANALISQQIPQEPIFFQAVWKMMQDTQKSVQKAIEVGQLEVPAEPPAQYAQAIRQARERAQRSSGLETRIVSPDKRLEN